MDIAMRNLDDNTNSKYLMSVFDFHIGYYLGNPAV